MKGGKDGGTHPPTPTPTGQTTEREAAAHFV